jgi:site-specific DNA-adenine methylase
VNQPSTTALANWFGTDRMLCDTIATELRGCSWVGVPFFGGGGVLARLQCNIGVASDLHRHVINLARVIQHPAMREQLKRRLMGLPLHEEVLGEAQARLIAREREQSLWQKDGGDLFNPVPFRTAKNVSNIPDVDWAADYYIASFMSRSGAAGTEAELTGGLSVRWKSGGGGSSQRWLSSIDSIDPWGPILERWTFVVMDAFEVLAQIQRVDAEAEAAGVKLANGAYCDPPFPGAGDAYRFRFTVADHRQLAMRLRSLRRTRVVLRYHDHPLIQELYGNDDHWVITRPAGRLQTNEAANELLILNGPSYAARSDAA